MPDRIRPRGDTAANWTLANPVLQDREIGLETDTRRYKIGNGASAWSALPYNQIGDRYSTTSATSNSVTNGAKTFIVDAGLAYTPQQSIAIVSSANPANHMHATVTSYSGTSLVVDVTKSTGSGTYSSWIINVAGVASAVEGYATTAQVAALTTQQLSAITVSAGTGLTGGGPLSANSTLSIAALSPNPAGTFGSSTQIPVLTVNQIGQITGVTTQAVSGGGGSATPTDVQIFTSSSTWTKPAGARAVNIQLLGGGGGGGGGRKASTAATTKFGGGGGAGGSYVNITVPAAVLSATETVTIGSGGSGGAGATTDPASGQNGISGTATRFNNFYAPGGSNGFGGTDTTGIRGIGGLQNNAGGNSSGVTAGSAGAPGTFVVEAELGGPGGGGGGGITTAAIGQNAGAGGISMVLNLSGGLAGASGGNAGGAGQNNINIGQGIFAAGSGGGGGGGAATASVSGGAGGDGGFPAGGGGGGGATQTGAQSGNGGAGAAGVAIITTYF